MTKKQVYRAYGRLWDSVTRYNGYQMFGYDVVTMRITHPGYYPALLRLKYLEVTAKD